MASDAVVHLIDDDEGVRQAVSFLLTTMGFAVRVYPSAVVFLDALPSLQPGCIVTDVRMPGDGWPGTAAGIEVARRWVASDRHHWPCRRAAGGRGDESRSSRFYREAVQ